MDKTYCETRGEKPFDWNRELDELIAGRSGSLTDDRRLDMAFHWVTCACGNQCAIIPRLSIEHNPGAPEDNQLAHLGMRFHDDITCRAWLGAKQTLARIEARSAILIAEELARLNHEPSQPTK